jgi:transposase
MERLNRIEAELADQAKPWRLSPVVEALQALRGVQWTVAVTTVAEVGDLTRFDTPRQLMAYLGLVPSEHSSGEKRRLGGITKTGNAHARRVLVEGAWAYRYPAKVSPHIQKRQEGGAKGALRQVRAHLPRHRFVLRAHVRSTTPPSTTCCSWIGWRG